MVSVVAIFAAALLIWAATRISLAEAATASEGRLMVLESWPHTSGRVLPILAANLAIGSPPIGLLIVQGRLFAIGLGSPAALVGVLAGILFAGVWLPMDVALMAYLYKRDASLA
jgi:hypothetical protein